MSFDLRIRFTGLMMWVPEGNSTMHVLMPSMASHIGHGHGDDHEPEHFAKLVYDVAYEQQGQMQLSREYQMIDLTNTVLDFSKVRSPDGIAVRLPDELANLAAVAGPVDPVLVRTGSDPRLSARVKLQSGLMTDYQLGARFTFEDSEKPQRIAPVTEWTIRNVTDSAGEEAQSLTGVVISGTNGDVPLVELHPVSRTLHLEVFHVTVKFLPPHHRVRFNPRASGSDSHFAAFYALCPPGPGGPRIPEAATGKQVVVKDKVGKSGQEVPGSICGQAKASL